MLLGSDEEGMPNQNGILTLTSFKGLLGYHEEDMQKIKMVSSFWLVLIVSLKVLTRKTGNLQGILTLTSLNGIWGSDKQDRQHLKGILSELYFIAVKPQFGCEDNVQWTTQPTWSYLAKNPCWYKVYLWIQL